MGVGQGACHSGKEPQRPVGGGQLADEIEVEGQVWWKWRGHKRPVPAFGAMQVAALALVNILGEQW